MQQNAVVSPQVSSDDAPSDRGRDCEPPADAGVTAQLTLSALLFENGLPNLPISLIEPHRNHRGLWRIKFCYENAEPLSMDPQQAATLATGLHQIDQQDLACEIDEAVKLASHYESM
jgi:hypothetical protein